MKKITDLVEIRWRTVHEKDSSGKRVKGKVQYIAKRPVKTVAQGPRFGHFIIDFIAFQIILYIVTYIFELTLNLTSFSISLNLTVALFSSIVILLLYPAFYPFCEFKWQKTPGKYLTKTLAIDEYGNRPGNCY